MPEPPLLVMRGIVKVLSGAHQPETAGIPVINLERIFDTAQAYRTWIGGDNYRMGLNAGDYIGKRLGGKGTVVELAGVDTLPLAQGRRRAQGDRALPADDGRVRDPHRPAARPEQGMGDLAEREIPASVTLFSAVVTKENVDTYLPLAFE